MRSMFISLLFSITIGNVLYAMENGEALGVGNGIAVCGPFSGHDRDDDYTEGSVKSVAESTELNGLESVELSTTSTRSEGCKFFRKNIESLDDMQKLSELVLRPRQTRSRHRNGPPEPEKFEIPEDVTIDPAVFKEYANNEGLIIEFEPGWFRRLLCGRFKGQNRFEHASFTARNEWAKKILVILSSRPDSPIEATTKKECDERGNNAIHCVGGVGSVEIDNGVLGTRASDVSLVTRRSSKCRMQIFDEEQDSDDTDPIVIFDEQQDTYDDGTGDIIRLLRQQLTEAAFKHNRLEKKVELNKEFNQFSAEQQKKEEKSDQRKERFITLFVAVAGVLVAYFESNAC